MKESKKQFVNEIKNSIRTKLFEYGLDRVSEVFDEVKKDYLAGIQKFGIKDPEQSWKPFKGGLVEEIIMASLTSKLNELDLIAIKGTELEKEDKFLSDCYAKAKRSLVVDYGNFGMHLPDADIVIIDKNDCKVLAILSSKTTLRERVAQTGYWFLKLKSSKATKNIKVYFITLDEDGELVVQNYVKKGRAIAEVDTDGTFVITTNQIQESNKVKKFDKFLDELSTLTNS